MSPATTQPESRQKTRGHVVLDVMRSAGGDCNSTILRDVLSEFGRADDPGQLDQDLDWLVCAGYMTRRKTQSMQLLRLTTEGWLTSLALRADFEGRDICELLLDDWRARE